MTASNVTSSLDIKRDQFSLHLSARLERKPHDAIKGLNGTTVSGTLGAHGVVGGFDVRVLHAPLHLHGDVVVDPPPGVSRGRVVAFSQHLAEPVVEGRPQSL